MKEQLEIHDEGALRHTRKRKKSAATALTTPVLEAPE